MLRQHRNFADDERQLAIAGAVEGEFDVALADLLALDDVPVVGAYIGLFFFSASNEKITSSGVTGLPSCQRAVGAQPVDDPGEIVGIGGGSASSP